MESNDLYILAENLNNFAETVKDDDWKSYVLSLAKQADDLAWHVRNIENELNYGGR